MTNVVCTNIMADKLIAIRMGKAKSLCEPVLSSMRALMHSGTNIFRFSIIILTNDIMNWRTLKMVTAM